MGTRYLAAATFRYFRGLYALDRAYQRLANVLGYLGYFEHIPIEDVSVELSFSKQMRINQ